MPPWGLKLGRPSTLSAPSFPICVGIGPPIWLHPNTNRFRSFNPRKSTGISPIRSLLLASSKLRSSNLPIPEGRDTNSWLCEIFRSWSWSRSRLLLCWNRPVTCIRSQVPIQKWCAVAFIERKLSSRRIEWETRCFLAAQICLHARLYKEVVQHEVIEVFKLAEMYRGPVLKRSFIWQS